MKDATPGGGPCFCTQTWCEGVDVEQIVRVVTDSSCDLPRRLVERLKIVVEPTGALAAAALFEGTVSAPGARVGVVLSGGNVDLDGFFSRYG